MQEVRVRAEAAPPEASRAPELMPAPVAAAVVAPVGVGAGVVLGGLGVALVLVGGWHLTQGTSGVGLGDLLRLAWQAAAGTPSPGSDAVDVSTLDILLGSRLPRMLAGVVVGVALGVAGAIFQSLARNALASPDTLAVTGGAFFAVTAVAAFGLAVPMWASGLLAFVGGLAAATLVLVLAGGAAAAGTRLVLAGSAIALALNAGTSTLLILFEQRTTSLYAWGSGSLSQLGLGGVAQAGPVVLFCLAAGLLLARRLDVLTLGDDTAAVLGVPLRATRAIGTILAVLLTAAAVTVAGPIGFVGLSAPVAVRLLAKVVPALHRHAVLLPAAGLAGALVVLGADIAMRAALGADQAIRIPTGVTTTVLGAIVLVALARRGRDTGATRRPAVVAVPVRSRRRVVVVLALAVLGVVLVAVTGLLSGHTMLRTGDIAAWLSGQGHPLVQFALDERAPRIAAALAAGAALALAGSLVQATCRNPLAEPGMLGITGGAGLGAVLVVTAGGKAGADTTTLVIAAAVGSLVSFAVVYGLSWRCGLDSDRLLLVGIGCWYGSVALSTLLLVRANPWDTPRIYTWLSGTTYGRTWDQLVPVAVALAVGIPLALAVVRELDLLALDEDTPVLVGVPLERVRLIVLVAAALLAAMSVTAVGVVGFVGLVAPHAARALVGAPHRRSVPLAVLLGATLLGVADTVGRTVIAPAQIPAGLVVALIGAPYFVYLLTQTARSA